MRSYRGVTKALLNVGVVRDAGTVRDSGVDGKGGLARVPVAELVPHKIESLLAVIDSLLLPETDSVVSVID